MRKSHFYSATSRRSRGATWSIFAPARTAITAQRKRRSGQVSNIAIDTIYQDAPNRIYVTGVPSGGGGGGAFRTDDGGNSWVCISDSLPFPDGQDYPTCFTVNPSQPLLYMGTESGEFYASSDLGQSWILLSKPSSDPLFKLVVDPRTAGDPSSTVIYAVSAGGLFRSADGGATFVDVFKSVFGQQSKVSVTSFSAYMPANGDDRYYVGSPKFTPGSMAELPGLLFSPAPLNFWVDLCSTGIGLPILPASSILVDYCRGNPDRVYACFLGSSETLALYTTGLPPTCYSANCWTQVQMISPPGTGNMAPFYPFAVAPNSPGDGEKDILFFGNTQLNRSPDGGKCWEVESQYAFHPDHHAYTFYPDVPQGNTIPALYVGCDGGIAMSGQHCNPSFNASISPTYFSQSPAIELDGAVGLGVYQNLNRGRQNSAIGCYASDPRIAALRYIGCQDTSLNAGNGSLGWRGFDYVAADVMSLAVAAGTQGVSLWQIRERDGSTIRWSIDNAVFSILTASVQLNGAVPGGRLCATLDSDCLADLYLVDTPRIHEDDLWPDYEMTVWNWHVTTRVCVFSPSA